MAVVKHNNRIIKYKGKIFSGRDPWVFRFTGDQFPTRTFENIILNAFAADSLRLTFIKPSVVTVDYGDGHVVRVNTIDYEGIYNSSLEKNVFYITANSAHTQLHEILPVHHYSTPLPEGEYREVKISYDAASLESIIGNFSYRMVPSNLELRWSAHSNLSSFSFYSPIFTSVNSVGLSSNSSPNLKSLDFRFFHSTSPYYGKFPVELFNLSLTHITFGNSSWNQSLKDGTTNMEELTNPIYNTRNTLHTIISYIPFEDETKDLVPLGFTDLQQPNIYVVLISTRSSTFPSFLDRLTNLRTLQFRGAVNLTSIGDISSCLRLGTLSFFRSQDVENIIFPSYFDNMIGLYSISYTECHGLRNQAGTTKIVSAIYDLITRNVVIGETHSNYYSFSVNISNSWDNQYYTAITGDIAPPSDFVEGVSNGTPTTSGEMLGVLVSSHYNMNLIYTTQT